MCWLGFLGGFYAGGMVGAFMGVVIMACLIVGGRSDREIERDLEPSGF